MRTQCPECKLVFDVPPEYIDKEVKCRRCDKIFHPEKFQKPPIVIPNLPSTGNFVIKLWTKSPTTFKTGFLTTLGVLLAILFFFKFSPVFSSKQPINPLTSIRSRLEADKLFLINNTPESGILRGRALSYYEFKRDVTRFNSYLRVWIDDRNLIVGITALYLGTITGSAADIIEDKVEVVCSQSVIDGFYHSVKWDPSPYEKISTEKDESGGIFWFHNEGVWKIEIKRSPQFSLFTPSEEHKKLAEFDAKMFNIPVDVNVYAYRTIAVTW